MNTSTGPISKNTRSQTRKIKRDSPIFKNTRSQTEKKIQIETEELKDIYLSISATLKNQAPTCKTTSSINLAGDFDNSINASAISSSRKETGETKISDTEFKDLEITINDNFRRSKRIQDIIEKEKYDYEIIEELENNLENTPREPDLNYNTNVDITPKTTLNNLITTGNTPLTDLIINFIKTQENSVIKTLKIDDISPVYNKKLQGCFNKANISCIKTRDASCDFVKEEQQMKDIWGIKVVTDYAKSKKSCCYLCKKNIVPSVTEMEHKIVCPIVFTQFLHYNKLKKLFFTGNNTSIFILWGEFKKTNQDSLTELYKLINCSSSNKSYPKEDINAKFIHIFSLFENYIKEEISIYNYDQFNKEFIFYKSFIKFWLMEFAYAHHTCNQGKHHHSYNTICGINEGIKQTYKRSKSTSDPKVTKEHRDANITTIVKGTNNRKPYLIAHFNHIKECGNEVCSNYHFISRATERIDAELATSIFIIKNLRRMYQSTRERNERNNKSNKKKTRKRKATPTPKSQPKSKKNKK